MWSAAALRPQCPQESFQQTLGLASGCVYVTWKTWGRGVTLKLTRWAGQRIPGCEQEPAMLELEVVTALVMPE